MKNIRIFLFIIIFVISCNNNSIGTNETNPTGADITNSKSINLNKNKSFLIVTEAWPPYVYEENGEVKGFDYEVVLAVFNRMGVDIKIEFYPWKRCIEMIKSQKAMAILDVGVNKERLAFMLFPKEKLSDSNSVLFYLKGEQKEVKSINDLTGKTVGVSRGYSYSDEFMNASNFKKEAVDNFKLNPEKLLSRRIDYFIYNRNSALFKMKGTSYMSRITYVKKPITSGENYLAFSLNDENRRFVKLFSEELKNFKHTSEYKQILAKYGQF